MDSLTVSSAMLIPSASDAEITPAMIAVIWNIAHELDFNRIPANIENSVWLEIPSKQLRPPDGRDDNGHLRKVLKQLTKIELEGKYRDDEWGAVLLAQWEFKQGGSLCRLLTPPAAIFACRAPKTFAKIEMVAAYKLKGHARRLYAELADKKHLRQSHWEYDLDELRALFQAQDKYERWVDFNRYVLTPALAEINDFGTVTVKAKAKKKGRAIDRVRFDWNWKTLDEARVTDEENERHAHARHKASDGQAPPLLDDGRRDELEADRMAFKQWEAEHGGTYGDFLSWKKTQGANDIMREAGFKK